MAGLELIDAYATLNVGRISLNQMYSGMTIYWSGSTGTDSLIRNNNTQDLKNRATGTGAWAGGIANAATATFAMALWGSGNTAQTAYSTVISGKKNSVTGTHASILNGSGNTINADFSTILNGVSNIISTTPHSVILGGYQNATSLSSSLMTMVGGSGNTILGNGFGSMNSAIIGGYGNVINADLSSIFTSINSLIVTTPSSNILGGYQNIIQGNSSLISIIGGSANTVNSSTSTNSAIIGGAIHRISAGANTVIIGGQNITATTDNSVYVPDLYIQAGKGIFVSQNLNSGDTSGQAKLQAGGTVTVPSSKVTNRSLIFVTPQDNNTVGALRIQSRISNTSFTIGSNTPSDTGEVAWWLIEPDL